MIKRKRERGSTNLTRLANVLVHSLDLLVKVVVMRLILLTDLVTEQVKPFAVFDGHTSPLGDPLLDLFQQRMSLEGQSVICMVKGKERRQTA